MIDHDYVFCDRGDAAHPTALILLNHEGSSPSLSLSPLMRRLWDCSSIRLCADGASSRLYHALQRGEDGARLEKCDPVVAQRLLYYQPDEIVGDWDSIDAESEAYYRSVGVPMYPQPEDQDSTDLEKCFRRLVIRQGVSGVGREYRVVVAGAFGGRLDHEVQNLNCLYKWTHCFHALAMVTEHSVASLLPPGGVEIRLRSPFEGPTCGLLPLGGPAKLTTKGLQWDLEGAVSSFGGMVSTSNCTLGTTVQVLTDTPVVWTVNVNSHSLGDCGGGGGGAPPLKF